MEKDSEMDKKSSGSGASSPDGSTRRKRKGLSLPVSASHHHHHDPDDDNTEVLLPQKKQAKVSTYSLTDGIGDQNSWNQKFELLRKFQRENGHTRVAFDFVVNSSALGCWVANQRTYYKNFMEAKNHDAFITPDRIIKLNSIGFEWICRKDADQFTKAEDEAWNQKFELLRSWQKENGHCHVPFGVMVNSAALGCWVANQREYYKNFVGENGGKKLITQERIDKLNSIGFAWKYETLCSFTKAEDEAWNQKFELLRNFQRENKHCRVPFSFMVNSAALGCWVEKQRTYYKKFVEGRSAGKNLITQGRIDELNSIGFEWSCEKVAPLSAKDTGTRSKKVAPSPKSRKEDKGQVKQCDDEAWFQKFEFLKKFQRDNGHCRVHSSYEVDSVKLGQWIINQRRYYKNFMGEGSGRRSITQERIDLLNSIGFEWRVNRGRKHADAKEIQEQGPNSTI